MAKNDDSIIKGVVVNLGSTDAKPYRVTNYDNRDFIPFGTDNLFPQACALLGRNSPNHRGVINSKLTYIVGNGFTSDDSKINSLIKKANFEGETLRDVIGKCALDDELMGNHYLEVITDNSGSFIYFNHLDATMARLARDKENIILYPDWTKYTDAKDKQAVTLPLYPKFKAVKNKYGRFVLRSVMHVKAYEPEFTYYGLPASLSGRDNMEIDYRTNRWNLSKLKNAFRLSGIMVVPVKDKDEAKEVLNYLEESHIGEGNNNKLLTITKSRAQEGEKADTTQFIETKQDDKGSWGDLINMSMAQVIIAHGWFRALTGVTDNTGFDTQRILNEYEVAQNTVIPKRQAYLLQSIQRVFKDIKGVNELDLRFINRPPIKDYRYMFVWEAREARGLPFDPNDPAQQTLILSNGQINNSQ